MANRFLQFSGCTVKHVSTLTRPTGPWQTFARKQRNASLILRKGLVVTADAAQHPRPRPQHRPEAVIVLGGGLTTQGGIPPWGQRRLDKAIQIYRQPGEVLLLVLASTLWQHIRGQLKFTVLAGYLHDLEYGSMEFCVLTKPYIVTANEGHKPALCVLRRVLSYLVFRRRDSAQTSSPVRQRSCHP